MNRTILLINFLMFQLVWFASVFGAANELPFLGLVVLGQVLLFHLWIAHDTEAEMLLIALVAITGAVVDTLLLQSGLVTYRTLQSSPSFAPVWIVTLWAGFASTLNVSMRWLRQRKLIASISGAILGPLAYLASARMGAVEIPDVAYASVVLGILWAFLVPCLIILASRLDGFRNDRNRGGVLC